MDFEFAFGVVRVVRFTILKQLLLLGFALYQLMERVRGEIWQGKCAVNSSLPHGISPSQPCIWMQMVVGVPIERGMAESMDIFLIYCVIFSFLVFTGIWKIRHQVEITEEGKKQSKATEVGDKKAVDFFNYPIILHFVLQFLIEAAVIFVVLWQCVAALLECIKLHGFGRRSVAVMLHSVVILAVAVYLMAIFCASVVALLTPRHNEIERRENVLSTTVPNTCVANVDFYSKACSDAHSVCSRNILKRECRQYLCDPLPSNNENLSGEYLIQNG